MTISFKDYKTMAYDAISRIPRGGFSLGRELETNLQEAKRQLLCSEMEMDKAYRLGVRVNNLVVKAGVKELTQ